MPIGTQTRCQALKVLWIKCLRQINSGAIPASVTIPAGQASVQIVLTPLIDTLVEGRE